MSQGVFGTIIPTTTSGNQLATILNDFKDAIISGMSGTSRPSEIDPGGTWVDTTNDPSWAFKMYDGVQDITIFTINTSTGSATIADADSLFTILRTSADSVGPILRLQKKRVGGGGQSLEDDTLAEIQFYGTRDTGAGVLQARIRSFSLDDTSATQAGAVITFEQASDATASVLEVMRLLDGKLGIGTQAPAESIHTTGNVLLEQQADDANSNGVKIRKRRVASSGQVLSGDSIGTIEMFSTDNAGAEVGAFRVETTATENHTAGNHGTRVSFKYKRDGTNTYKEEAYLDDSGLNVDRLNVTKLVATTTELGTVVETEDAKLVVNKNGTQAMANAAPAGIEVEITDGTNAALAYDSSLASKWKIGEVGTLKEVVTVGDTQTLTAKTLTSPTINNPARAGVKEDTEANLTTYASTATNGQLCFATDTKVMYQVIDTELVPLGAGGGGVSLIWKEYSNAPIQIFDEMFDLRAFDDESSQQLYATLTVPQSYRVGKQIRLKAAHFFCLATTGNVFFKTVATLINSSTVKGTYPNQRTSSNAQVAVAAVANTRTSVGDLDLTDATGQINGVTVQPGDKIRIRIFRDNANETSGATEDAEMIMDGIEPTFS